MSRRFLGPCGLGLILALAGCGGAATPPDAGEEVPAGALSAFDELPEDLQRRLEPWKGDLDGMIERRLVRVLTVFNPMLYFLDGPRQRGVVYESVTRLEMRLNKKLRRSRLRVDFVIIPVNRKELLPALLAGRGDIVAANLTVTPERKQQVDFTRPTLKGVSEVLVTGPTAPRIGQLDDLSGKQLRLRRSSSYWASVERLNVDLREAGLPEVELEPGSEWVEDGGVLELVQSGALPMTIVDSHKARFWAQFLDKLVIRDDIAVRTGGDIAWAIRKGSPKLAKELNAFIARHAKGTLFGNVVYKRYLEDNRWVHDSMDSSSERRFREMEGLFRKYAERYELDWLLLTAQGFQESGLDQSRRSRAGAVGVMQLRPVAGREVGITNLEDLESNIHAGAKYLRHIMDTYFSDEGLSASQQQLFGLAAYNAGPSRIRRLQGEAAKAGLDPHRWFDNVEVVAARKIGAEPVRYVSNITKYYVVYTLLTQQPGFEASLRPGLQSEPELEAAAPRREANSSVGGLPG